MRVIVCIIVFCIEYCCACGQKQFDVCLFRDYKYSLLLNIYNEKQTERYIYSSYGNAKSHLSKKNNSKYLYQGQELLSELDIYLFPYRTYSGKEKRFQQPDPKSQYFSPYLFVGADPVNSFDPDGQQSKLLIVYEESHRGEGQEFEQAVDNFKHTFGDDAYFVPMSDFVSGKVPPLPEWNGNTYILSHMGEVNRKPIIEAEKGKTFEDLKLKSTRKFPVNKFHAQGDCFVSQINPRDFGRQLRTLARDNRVVLNNVMAGGCNSSLVAEEISKGIIGNSNEMTASRSFRVYGLNREYESQTIGVVEGLSEHHEYFIPRDRTIGFDRNDIVPGMPPPVRLYNDGIVTGVPPQVAGSVAVRDLANGEVPAEARHLFMMYPGYY